MTEPVHFMTGWMIQWIRLNSHSSTFFFFSSFFSLQICSFSPLKTSLKSRFHNRSHRKPTTLSEEKKKGSFFFPPHFPLHSLFHLSFFHSIYLYLSLALSRGLSFSLCAYVRYSIGFIPPHWPFLSQRQDQHNENVLNAVEGAIQSWVTENALPNDHSVAIEHELCHHANEHL